MQKPELLAPAGDWEKMEYALAYGADAVYLSGRMFGLRAYAGNFSAEELREAAVWTRGLGRKIYVAVNVFAHEDDFQELPAYLRQLAEMKADGIIVSDPGVIALAREVTPELDIHLSTQANSTNSFTVNYWLRQGVKRVNLARELTLEEMRAVRSKTGGELEVFIHGAMCMSYSGRCLLSNYLTGRDANRGECTQPCRWKYSLVEEKRPGEVFPLEEDERGTYIFNSHDLCLLPYLPELMAVSPDSFKIEGRMKSVLYVAGTVKVYREAIDVLWDEGETAFQARLPGWLTELDKFSHRDYSPGFLFGKPGGESHNLETSHYVRDYDFVGVSLQGKSFSEEKQAAEGDVYDRTEQTACGEYSKENKQAASAEQSCTAWVEQRNHFKAGDVLEVLAPGETPWSFTVTQIRDELGSALDAARHAQQKVRLAVPRIFRPYSILRRAKT